MTLFTYSFYHPIYKQWNLLDYASETREIALVSARKWIDGQNRRMRKIGVKARFQVPAHINHLKTDAERSQTIPADVAA